MTRSLRLYSISFLVLLALFGKLRSQSSTGTIFGTITDENNAVIAGATVTARNFATEFTRSTTSNSDGVYRFANIPIGSYEISFDAPNFSQFKRSGITLDVGQEARVDALLSAGGVREIVSVDENASMLDSTTTEVNTRFDSRRLSELPIAPNRSLYNTLLSAPGVNQRAPGQTAFAVGISLTVNGGRIRSNNFQLDGQDINDPALGGTQMALNNPDAIQEVRIITSQFLPEHGHNTASVVDVVSRSGTNELHGSAFWFHNNENLNACSNTDKRAGFCDPNALDGAKSGAPYRRENQVGFTIGGPVFVPRFGEGGPYFYNGRKRTFFFADYQRWSDRRTPSLTLSGAPTQAGRDLLQPYAVNRAQVAALLRFVPAGIPNGKFRTVIVTDGSTFDVPLGDLTSSADLRFDSHQGSIRIDHIPDEKNLLFARYRYNYETTRRAAQITPPGHGTMIDLSAHAVVLVWTSAISPNVSNEARVGWKRYSLARDAEETSGYSIPAIEISDLGMNGGPEAETRTAFGLPTNLPVYRTSDGFQLTDAISIFKGNHAIKLGGELRSTDEKSALFSLDRGSLVYDKLSNFVNDTAQSGSKGLPLPGSDTTQFYRWQEAYFYLQDQWRIRPNLTLLYGIRYEYPGDSFRYLRDVNERIVAANNNNPDYRFEPYPKADTNNWMPRVGFNWYPRTSGKGVIGFITGGERLVIRGGYARTYDAWTVNINQNIYTSFPFTGTQTLRSPFTNAFTTLVGITTPNIENPKMLTRVIPGKDFRSPAFDQISLDVQRELFTDYLLGIRYIRTRGTGLFQTVQGNPRRLCPFGPNCNSTLIDLITGGQASATRPQDRVDPDRGIISIRANSASSTYDSLQASLEKRLSRGFSFGLHYTWSSLIDTASDIFSPSVAEAGTSQNPYDWNGDKGRGSYDRPHRLAGNFVYELPFFSKQRGLVGKLLGGWQINSFFNFQSGAPFSVSVGSDPTGSGNPLRPNLFTNLDLSRMSVTELYQTDQQLRAQARAKAQQIFDEMIRISTPVRCDSSAWLGGTPLPLTLFSAPRGRIVCDARGQRSLDIVYFGILEGQSFGNAGRNILRADGFREVNIGVIKNTKLTETVRAQVWVDFFNAFNWRNFGIPSGVITAPDFLDQWTTDGGSRRIRLGARLVF